MSYDSLRTQQATYWAPRTANGFGGFTYDTPVSLFVRWQDNQERLVDSEGKEFISQAVIYAGQALSLNGWLYRGVSVAAAPIQGAYRIRISGRSDNPSGSIVVRRVVL